MKRFLLLCIVFGYFLPLQATVIIPIKNPAGSSNLLSFPQPIQAKAFDRANGTFFVGLAPGGGNLALSAATISFGDNSIFNGIALDVPFNQNRGIEFLTLATFTGNNNPILVAVIEGVNGPQTAYAVATSNSTGTKTGDESSRINDASGAVNINGLPTSGIVGLAASQFFALPAVKPCGGNFGSDCNGGIASVAINQTTLSVTQVPAESGYGGIKAALFDATIPQVLINNSPTIVPNTVDLFWDDQLQRLYIGIQLTTAGTSTVGTTCHIGTGVCNTAPLICPTGFKPDYAAQACVTCPSGGIYNSFGSMCELCPTGQLFNPNAFQCQTVTCSPGFFFNTDPTVLACASCFTGWTSDGITCFTCPNGGIFNPHFGCIACPSGQTFNPTAGICTTGPITCPSGQVMNPNGFCVTPPICPPGFTADLINVTCVPEIPDPFPPDPQPIPPLLNNMKGPISISAMPPLRSIDTRALLPSGGRSIVAASVDSAGIITFADIAPDSAFALNNLDNMVGVFSNTPQSLAINKVRMLHVSTGPSYLIINGGNGTINQVNGKIFALPLVDLSDPTDPAQGTIADKNSALDANFKFVTPATTPAGMPLDTDPAVIVGTGSLALPFTGLISDIDVIGDTVYVSIDNDPASTTEGGILYSQALFDETGKIIRWTPWTKKVFPPFDTESQTNTSAVTFFSVDAYTNKTWVVDDERTTVVQNSWSDAKSTVSFPNSSLIGQLNAAITGTASAVLDLDQSTRGFLANQSRYALFAGDVKGATKIIFARISQSLGASVLSPQTVITDFLLASNFLITPLPTNTCQIQVLEYARQLTGTPTNYFFAGTQNGLFVFSDSGNGFDVSTMGNLNAAPFSNGSWQLAPNIAGSVVDIKTTGNTLYVLVQKPANATSAMMSILYRIPFASTVAAMFAPANIIPIAQTGTGIFSNIFSFNGLQIISTTPDGSTEQVVLTTNNGLYQSTRIGGVQDAANQSDAAWMLITNTNFYYNGIAAVDNASIPVASPSTVWPFYIADTGGKTFDQSVLQQLNGSKDTVPFAFVPLFFNSIESNNPEFTTIPLIANFWSDGARRLMTISNIESAILPEDLLTLPFNTIEWDIDNPDDGILSDPVLNEIIDIYWIKQIGVSGLLLLGTDIGIVGLA